MPTTGPPTLPGRSQAAGTLALRPLTRRDEPAARAAHHELETDHLCFLLDENEAQTWAEYVDRLAQVSARIPAGQDRVPATILVADVAGQIVGRTCIRHELNDYLAAFGGHIGYCVRPQFRRRG